jgi:uncharacterized protein (UPF0333 family)
MDYVTRAVALATKSKILDRTLLLEVEAPLYCLIEIKNPWYPANSVGFKIIQTVKEKYSGNNFEDVLEETNEMLARLTEEGNTEWLGKLSAIIAKIDQNKLSLTSVGNAKCLLFRQQNMIEVTEGQPTETHPLKTFSQILSGELEENDKLIIGNQDFFEFISIDYLKQVLGKESLTQACSYIGRSLSKQKAKTASALILELTKTPSEIPLFSVVYIDEDKRLINFWQKIKPAFPKIAYFFKVLANSICKFFSSPLFINLFHKSKKIFKKHQKRFLLGLSILLILVLIFGVFDHIFKQQKTKESEMQRKVTIEAEGLNKQAQDALSKGNKEEAKKILEQALALFAQVKNKEQIQIFSKIVSELDKLNNINKINPKMVLDFQQNFKDADVAQIFFVNKTIYSIDLKNNRIYQGNESPNSLPQYSGKNIAGVYQAPENLLIFYQDSEGIYEYNIDENKAEKAEILLEEKWKKAKILGTYFTNLYLLDPDEGQIYKYEKTGAGYSKGTPYVDKEKIDLKKAISMALDGYIYVLNNDGNVFKLMAGRMVSDFKISGIPQPDSQIKNPVKIFTSALVPNLYILGNNRILEFDKSGNYQRMFVFNLPDIKDLWVDYKTKKLYLLSGTKVYETGI